ncbi:hypothetical protein DFH06DRAFT_1305299 [Mycena polygramma]|nr:hypothetical protein DFH06DRAFT_1305299 [Mycena polygramma]
MSSPRATTRKQMPSALNGRGAGPFGPFGDATNRMFNSSSEGLATEKPVSRREARLLTKRARGNATTRNSRQADVPRMPRRVVEAPPSSEPTPPPTPLPWMAPPPNMHPVLIIRTLAGARPKKYYGQFEACSREDVLVEETRTWEEDVLGVYYGPYDIATTILGTVEVITHQAEVGQPGSTQIFYAEVGQLGNAQAQIFKFYG